MKKGYKEEGNIVIYNGKIEYAFDIATEKLMKSHLIIGAKYTIHNISEYGHQGTCYEFYEIDCWYPAVCFNCDIAKIYGLK